MDRIRVGVVYGGRSVEHEVSVASATSIVSALDPSRYEVTLLCVGPDGRWRLGAPGALPASAESGEEVRLPAVPGDGTLLRGDGGAAGRIDVVLPIVHGTGGEDGSLQGFLDLANLPYVGSGVLGSAVQMDKDVTKRLLRDAGMPVLDWVVVRTETLPREEGTAIESAVGTLGFPVFVKPASLGSSVGIHRAANRDELRDALHDAARYDDKLLIEQAADGREIEVAVLGNDRPEASVPGEIRSRHEFYDYEAKYVEEDTELIVPAEVSEETSDTLRELAIRAFTVLEGRGMARVDFFVDRQTDRIWINEVNSLPGFTEAGSMYPRLWQASGLPYPALLDRLIELALERHERRAGLERTYRRGG